MDFWSVQNLSNIPPLFIILFILECITHLVTKKPIDRTYETSLPMIADDNITI